MEIGMVGLGRMGANMALRLKRGGHRVVVTDASEEAVRAAEAAGAIGARTLEDLARALQPPRAVWLMVPAGEATEKTVAVLLDLLQRGDVIVDGGNSNYKQSMRRAALAAERGIVFVDAGTSGGIWGLEGGYSLMLGGSADAIELLRPAIKTLAPAPDRGWGHVGPSGAGHFVKMVHNGIEYGLMQAYAEGFDLLRAKAEFGLDLHQVAEIWRHGSVVRSWLLDLVERALAADPELTSLRAWVGDSGEGRWTVDEAVELGVPTPAIAISLMARFASRQENSFAGRLLAALRQQFGGHAVRETD